VGRMYCGVVGVEEMKIAFLFPGQGAQYLGMGREIFEKYQAAQEIFLRAGEILKLDIAHICFEGPESALVLTRNCQPAILTVSLACLEALKEDNPSLMPQAVAGLSLGEFTALTVAGGLSFEDVLRIVQARGQFMQESCDEKPGTMASILGLDYLKVSQICKSLQDKFIVAVANVNCPSQIVVSGETEGVRHAVEEAKRQGARRAIELQVSGAFHSPLMEDARLKLKKFLSNFEIRPPKTIFVSNVLGRAVQDPNQIRDLLIEQVTHSVLWEQGIRDLIEKGFHSFAEVGCGKVLSGLQKKIDPESKISHVEDLESLEETKNSLSVKSEA